MTTGSKQKIPQFAKPTLSRLTTLAHTEPTLLHLRDSEVVSFKRASSPLWQCRYKLAEGAEEERLFQLALSADASSAEMASNRARVFPVGTTLFIRESALLLSIFIQLLSSKRFRW